MASWYRWSEKSLGQKKFGHGGFYSRETFRSAVAGPLDYLPVIDTYSRRPTFG